MSLEPQAVYSALLAVTFGLHLWLVAGVVWGTAAIFVGALRGRTPGPLERSVRDWLPFLLSAAITAGVAPLLFVQVLHPTAFYSASRLMPARWLALAPVLVAGFYLLYALKSEADLRGGRVRRIALPALALGAFGYVGATFARNHLVSLGGRELWVALAAGDAAFVVGPLLVRLLLVSAAAAPLAAAHALWMVGARAADGSRLSPEALRSARRRLAGVGLCGVLLAGVAVLLAAAGIGDGRALSARGAPLARSFFSAAGGLAPAGLTLAAAGWLGVRSGDARAARLAVHVGSVLCAIGVGFAREGARLARGSEEELARRAAETATTAGLSVFLGGFVLCLALALWSLRLSTRSEGGAPREEARPSA